MSENEEEISTSMAIGTPTQSRRREIRGIDIGQQIMPGRTRQKTHDTIQLVEENLDNFYQDCALMSAIVTGKVMSLRHFKQHGITMTKKNERNGGPSYQRNFTT